MGKKKKGLSNRLAKMSDEERARYLQHRAAIEEEAKRRKEQLIATYIKKKLKKEEAFTRLNIAKINEHWHHILRKIKISELKKEIIDLKKRMSEIIDLKNSIIIRLMNELEEAEEQYQFNLKNHLSHIDNFIGIYFDRQQILDEDFQEHLNEFKTDSDKEIKTIIEKACEEEIYLKTIIYGMETNFNKFVEEMQNFRQAKIDDFSNSLKARYETMVKIYDTSMGTTWQNINRILRDYMTRVSLRRNHYIELFYLDRRFTAERQRNDKKIEKFTELIKNLKIENELLYDRNEYQIKILSEQKQKLSEELQRLQRKLTIEIKNDEKILKNMTVCSKTAIKNLEKLLEKGDKIKIFVAFCSRLQTEKEKLEYWIKFHGKFEENLQDFEKSQELQETEENISDDLQILTKIEGLWWSYNKIKVECIQLQKEKDILIAENENMKKIIKGLLRDAALEVKPPKPFTYPVITKIKSTSLSERPDMQYLIVDL